MLKIMVDFKYQVSNFYFKYTIAFSLFYNALFCVASCGLLNILNNLNNFKNIWKSIRSLIVIKLLSASNTHMLTHKGTAVTNPLHIANSFNDYFILITEKSVSIKVNIKFLNKSFPDFLHHPNEELSK